MRLSKKKIRGYTIIELLAVVSILVIISSVIVGILYGSLRGSSKTKITTEVVQNGNYVLSVFSSAVVDSVNVTQINGVNINDCTASPSGTSVTLKRLDESTTTFSCANNSVSSGSASLINESQVQIGDNSCTFYCDQKSDDAYAIPIVGVKFTLEDKNTGLFETRSSSIFETSVSIRNFSP